MIYSDIHLPIPQDPRIERFSNRSSNVYLRFRVSSYYNEKGQKRYERLNIGKILQDEVTGDEYFCPNENYYLKFLQKPLPQRATQKGYGKGNHPSKISQLTYDFGIIDSSAYILACLKIVSELALDKVLEDCFYYDAKTIMTAAAFFVALAPGGICSIDYFSEKEKGAKTRALDIQDLQDLCTDLTENDCDEFFEKYLENKRDANVICYSVPLITPKDRFYGKLSILSQESSLNLQTYVSILCTAQEKVPLYAYAHIGSINDYFNLKNLKEKVQSVGIYKRHKIALVLDRPNIQVGEIHDAFDCGYDLISRIPYALEDKVREHILQWQKAPTQDDKDNSFTLESDVLSFKELPFTLDGIKGRLILFKSPISYSEHLATLADMLEHMENELKALSHIDTELAKKYQPAFKIDIHDDGSFSFEKDIKELTKAKHLCGVFALFTTCHDLSCKDVLSIYRAKRSVVEPFTIEARNLSEVYNSFGDLPNQFFGKVLLLFIGALIRHKLICKLTPYLDESGTDLEYALYLLTDLRCHTEDNNMVIARAPRPLQIELVKALELPINFLYR